ncbi:alpha/beta fold hydrolase [Microbacterium terricola]|uniref:Alpha/beta hydrolase n=1 Tax=Microbacterium terricola TaxID=344163 RepID=A0ABM8E0F3_9MICO|nr:alpha/beta hydrolase [Microbacterium terricola]UYK41013.1 alpha/beta hydrolase [Microbacterium terricola]BDV31230.1 alpha/beta hydrolase [Microbacterium terricola]
MTRDTSDVGAVVDVRSLTAADAQGLDAALPDRDWAVLPAGFRRVAFTVPSGELAGFEIGPIDGCPVVLVPGVTGSKEDFVLMAPLLAAAGFRVISFDLAGQYESAAAGPERLSPPRPHYDHPLFEDDLVAVLETLPEPAHLLGYSFAGTVAQLVAVHRRDLVASLSLLGCPPISGQAFRDVKVLGPMSRWTPPSAGAALMIWGVRNNLNRVKPGRVAFARARFSLTRRDSVRDVIGLMRATPDLDAPLRRTGIPIFVAAGHHDLWPGAAHRAFAERLGARLALYTTGHSPCETTPHELSRDLVALYDEVDTSGSS